MKLFSFEIHVVTHSHHTHVVYVCIILYMKNRCEYFW